MRCRCCDNPHTQWYGEQEPDWYCTRCIEAIKRATGDNFGLSELEEIILGEEDFPGEPNE